jgi:hypothetical protein
MITARAPFQLNEIEDTMFTETGNRGCRKIRKARFGTATTEMALITK